ncbi:hypothetical protein ACSBL2_17430 [Pedobacter sp. AW31-3R]|uniref:hypothetical protein n=1 Tax=Pedobacter sp. AW31-3R TaxID=3445781 RepID=UPI003F9F0BAA
MKIHLISYGDAKYTTQKDFLRDTALASSFFDNIVIYGNQDLDRSFVAQYQSILMNYRGGGYWIWKPYIVNKFLATIPKEDVLVYCDAGCMINGRAGKRFQEYIDVLMQSDTGSVAFDLGFKEFEYTKQEVFDYFESTSAMKFSDQLVGGIFLLKKCVHTTSLVDEWYHTLQKNPRLFTEDRNIQQQHPDFVKHQSDQSIFSIIRKTMGTEIIPDESYFLDFLREGQHSPIWATRLRG